MFKKEAVHLLLIPFHGLFEPANSSQVFLRHPETTIYRCFLSDLTGFAGLRRAGPTRTAVRIPDVGRDVNRELDKT